MIKKGRLEVLVGCMSSGKSEELIRRVTRAVIAKQKVLVVKPKLDTRTDDVSIVSRDGKKHSAITVASSSEVLQLAQAKKPHVIAIEEAQFFDGELPSVAEKLVEQGHRVIVAGLNTDYRGQPFGTIPQLLALADETVTLSAICMQCGGEATRTQMRVPPPEEGNVLIGGDEEYEARCRDCHDIPVNIASLADEPPYQ